LGIDIEFLVMLLKRNTDNVAGGCVICAQVNFARPIARIHSPRRGRFEGADSNMKVLSYLSDKDMVFPIIY
jgi:hypothetical protein